MRGMLQFRISELVPAGIAAGATLGNRHRLGLLDQIPRDLLTSTVLVDFALLEGVTASYLKAFLAPLLESNDTATASSLDDALRIHVFVVNLGDDIREDLNAALASIGKPCLEAIEWSEDGVTRARIHGPIEQKIADAFDDLITVGGGTAADMRQRDRSVGVTGWHYRLGELHKLGFARRTKAGRSWKYEPIATEVVRG